MGHFKLDPGRGPKLISSFGSVTVSAPGHGLCRAVFSEFGQVLQAVSEFRVHPLQKWALRRFKNVDSNLRGARNLE